MARSVTLQQINTAIRQRSDSNIENTATGYLADAELNGYINSSFAEYWELVVDSFGENWEMNTYTISPIAGQAIYPLPYDFFKEQEVDVFVDATQTRKVEVKKFEETERNIYSSLVATAYTGLWYTNLRYSIVTLNQVQNIEFIPSLGPSPQIVTMRYSQAAPIMVTAAPMAYAPNTAYAANTYVSSPSLAITGLPSTPQVFMVQTAGTSGTTAIGSGAIGIGAATVAYQSNVPNQVVTVVQITGGVSGVSVSGSTITVQLGGATAATIVGLVNANASAAALVTASFISGGGSAATGGTATLSTWSIPGLTTDGSVVLAYVAPASMVVTSVDFINGWEEYVITDGVLKVKAKNESDLQFEMAAKQALIARIKEASRNRDSGQPRYITDIYGNGLEGQGPWGGGWSPY